MVNHNAYEMMNSYKVMINRFYMVGSISNDECKEMLALVDECICLYDHCKLNELLEKLTQLSDWVEFLHERANMALEDYYVC